MAWDNYGVWADNVTQENGEWLIGDQLPKSHPGHVDAEDPRGLMVKHWTANQKDPSGKYLGEGHLSPLPAHGGRLEGVQVLSGSFWCRSCSTERGDVDHVLGIGRKYGDCVEIAPNVPRTWRLPESIAFAAGVTICRRSDEIPEVFGSGEGYEYLVLDTDRTKPEEWPELLRHPIPATGYSHQLIMVFRGILLCEHPGVMVTHQLAACSTFLRGYAYTSPRNEGVWRPVNTLRTIAAVVRY